MEMFVVGLGLALIVAVLIGKDAESRGMSGFGWGAFTFLCMLIAVPIYVIVRKARPSG